MTSHFSRLKAALISYTRLPLAGAALHDDDFREAIAYLPAAGLLVGLLASAAGALTACFLPTGIAVFVALLSGILLTGALHEDGFADCCDGFAASRNPADILRIMKDPAVGSYATIGLITLLGGKYLLLMQTLPEKLWLILPAMHVLGRYVPLLLIAGTPRISNPQAKMSAGLLLSRQQLYAAGLFCLLLALVLLPPVLVLLLALTLALLSVICRRFFIHRLGGYNGDCLGAAEQLGEVTCLLVCAIYYGG